MSNADFNHYGYQIVELLGQNYLQGRFTYKATNSQGQTVVIKQFQFVTSKNWAGYKAVEREVEVLQTLDHPSIPQILETFDPGNGICLVQEYKDAQPLSIPRRFTPEEVQRIAIATLEILVYLQRQVPPIIHRDIKPENVLVDDQLNVYLIDFGFARTDQPGVALSSQVAGTFGFMPPEQLFNRPLSSATDLYSLGATLICLLSGTPSTEIGTLINERFQFRFQPPPHLHRQFVQWLQKMVQPELKHRFSDATEALDALKAIRHDALQGQLSWLRATEQSFSKLKEAAGNFQSSLQQALFALRRSPKILLLWWLVCFAVASLIAAAGTSVWGITTGAIAGVILGAILGLGEEQLRKGTLAGAIAGAMTGAVVGAMAKIAIGLGASAVVGAVFGFGLASTAIVLAIDLSLTEQFKSNRTSSFLAIVSGIGTAIFFKTGFSYLSIGILSTVASVLFLARQRLLPAEAGESE